MLLRSITKHVNNQNWFAVALDFTIVVLGVFVGFQVQQWNNERGNLKLERQYLERLLTDVNHSIERTTINRDRIIELNRKTGLILNSLRDCRLPVDQRDDFAKGIFDFGKISPSEFPTGTIDEMLSSGAFSILSNTEIRDILNDLLSEERHERFIFPAINHTKTLAHAQVYEHIVFLIDDPMIGVEEISWNNIDFDFDSMCEDKKIHAAVSSVRLRGGENIYFFDRSLNVFDRAKSALENELGQVK